MIYLCLILAQTFLSFLSIHRTFLSESKISQKTLILQSISLQHRELERKPLNSLVYRMTVNTKKKKYIYLLVYRAPRRFSVFQLEILVVSASATIFSSFDLILWGNMRSETCEVKRNLKINFIWRKILHEKNTLAQELHII